MGSNSIILFNIPVDIFYRTIRMAGSFSVVKALVITAVGCMLLACTVDDETRVRESLSAMQQAVENRQAREFVSYLADGFEDQKGRDAKALRGYLAGLFIRNASIHVFLGSIDVQVNGNSARTSCLVTVTGGQGIIPERMRRVELLLEWKKHSGDWKVYRANWNESV